MPGDLPLIFTSSDETVAAVDAEGNITALAEGTALITLRTEDGRYVDRCLVEVGDFADEEEVKKTGPDAMLIAGICLAVVAVAAVAVVLVLALKRRKK